MFHVHENLMFINDRHVSPALFDLGSIALQDYSSPTLLQATFAILDKDSEVYGWRPRGLGYVGHLKRRGPDALPAGPLPLTIGLTAHVSYLNPKLAHVNRLEPSKCFCGFPASQWPLEAASRPWCRIHGRV